MICILSFAGIDKWFDYHQKLPAHDWIADNLEKIKTDQTKGKTDNYVFSVFGDNKDSHIIFPELLKQMSRDKNIKFAMELGDLVSYADVEKYRYYFTMVRRNLDIPLLTAIGNHELRKEGRELYYDLLGPFYYSFKTGRDYFIIIDDANEKSIDKFQYQWIENELKKSVGYSNRFIFMHVPLFDPRGNQYHHCLAPQAAHSLIALFKKYSVTHIFASHIHSYYNGQWDGIPFTITGGGGAGLVGKNSDHAFFHYLKVSVKGGQVNISVVPVPVPQYYEWLHPVLLVSLSVYTAIRLHGIKISIFLFMLYFLISGYSGHEVDPDLPALFHNKKGTKAA